MGHYCVNLSDSKTRKTQRSQPKLSVFLQLKIVQFFRFEIGISDTEKSWQRVGLGASWDWKIYLEKKKRSHC